MHKEAKQFLTESLANLTESPIANSEAGFFLWQFFDEMSLGKVAALKAYKLNPSNSRIVMRYAEMSANPTGNLSDTIRAIQLLRKVIALEPDWAYPHSLLYNCYLVTKQPRLAKNELETYFDLHYDGKGKRKKNQQRIKDLEKMIADTRQ